MDKEQLRRRLQKCMAEMSDEQSSEKSKRACENLISTRQFQDASTIMMYLSLPREMDPSMAILRAWQLGKTVGAPKVSWEQRHMIAVEIHSLESGFSTEVAGLRNPITGMPIPFEEIDLVITPGLGFDRQGNRLGRGGSYYDKFFAENGIKALRCGFCFSEQLLDSVPATETDVPMDFLVTDEEILSFTKN